MGFRINRGIFQYKDGEDFRNKFKIAEDGTMVEVDVDGNPTTAYMKIGDKATDSDKVDGKHANNSGGGIPVLNSNGYWNSPNWINIYGHGLYSSSMNGAHFLPNNQSHGSWKILGSRNGWMGLHFGEGTGVTLMMNEAESGIYRKGSGWKYRHQGGKFYVHTGTNGGGAGYEVFHKGNLTPIPYETGQFTVGGDAETYYPVILSKSSRTTGTFTIYRDNVHQNESGRGAGRLVLTGFTSGWGHVPLTLHYESKISGTVLWKFLASNYRTGLMVVYLKGATTYYYKSEHGFSLHDTNTQGSDKSDGRTNWLPTKTVETNAAWEGETPSVLTIEHGSFYYDGQIKAGSFKGDGSSISNVDAQTLDGVNSTQFLRSDAEDTKSGNTIFTGNVWIDNTGRLGSSKYEWTNSALTTTSIEIVDDNSDNSGTSPTLVLHNYGDGGVQFRMGNTGDKYLHLSSAKADGAGSASDDTSGRYFVGVKVNGNILATETYASTVAGDVESTLTPQIATAQTTADNAATAASNAQTTADSALTTAQTAETRANSAREDAAAIGDAALMKSGGTMTGQLTTGTGGLGIKRNSQNGTIWFNAGTDTNHALWNGYYGNNPNTRGAANTGFDGMLWNTLRGIQIRGGSSGAYNLIVAENSSGASNNHTVKLYASNVLRLQTSTSGVTVTGTLNSTNISTNQVFMQSITSDGDIANDKGSYLHIGGWGVGRTAANAVLVNTAYRADYATNLFNENISRFANDANYLTQDALTDLEEGLRAEINTAQTTADSKLGATAKAADSDKLDGYDSAYYFRARGGIGNTDATPGSTTGWGNNPAGGTYTTDYVGHGGTVIMSNDVGGSAASIAIESTYYGDMYIHSNTDSNQWLTKRVWTSYNFDPDSKLGATAKAADANKLDGYDWGQSGKNVRATEFYADNWFRNYNSGEGLFNQATGQHWYSDDDDYWNVAGGGSANGIRFRDQHAGTIRGYVYANSSNQVGFLDSDGHWAVKVVRDSHVELRDNNETVFTAGQGGHSSNYGTVCTHGGGRGGWEGYSINGRFVWMSADSSSSGIYNDTDNEWMTRWHRNGATELYHNGSRKFLTNGSGVTTEGNMTVSGSVTASSFSGNGSGLTGVSAPIPFTTVIGEATACVSMNFDGRAMVFTMADGTSYSIDGARPNG